MRNTLWIPEKIRFNLVRRFILYNAMRNTPIPPSFLMEHGIPEKVRLETKLGIKISRLFPILSFPNERQPFPNKEHLMKTIFEGSSQSDNKISRKKLLCDFALALYCLFLTFYFCPCPLFETFTFIMKNKLTPWHQ